MNIAVRTFGALSVAFALGCGGGNNEGQSPTNKLDIPTCEAWMFHISDLMDQEIQSTIDRYCRSPETHRKITEVMTGALDSMHDAVRQSCKGLKGGTYKQSEADCIMATPTIHALADCHLEGWDPKSMEKAVATIRSSVKASCDAIDRQNSQTTPAPDKI